MSNDFWRDRRVFVTGHTGFKGSWLSLWLQSLGARTTGFAHLPPTHPSLFGPAAVADGMTSVVGDVRDAAGLETAMRAAEPEVIFHLAAQPIVRRSYRDPLETFATNVLGTANLLEAARRVGSARAVVIVTSDKCYENREWFWSYREKSALGGHDPYSASKACAELVARSFRKSYFEQLPPERRISSATVRAGNVIGGGDWAEDRLVPDTVRSLTGGSELALRFPAAIRPWQHVLEPLSGYLLLGEKLFEEGTPFAQPWNFAPNEDDAKSVGWMVDRMHEAWGVPARWHSDESPKPHEAIYLKLDSSKAKTLLGWRPRLRIDETVSWVVEWYRRSQAGESPRALCAEQIARYEALA